MNYDLNKDPLAIAVEALKRGDMTTFDAMGMAFERMRRPILTNPQTQEDIKTVSVRCGDACQSIQFQPNQG